MKKGDKVEITQFEQVTENRRVVPKTYSNKKTGEIVKIQWKTKEQAFVII